MQVYEAYLAVKANKGAAGIDSVSLEQFGVNLKGNLYKIWNRMNAGSYFPPPVKGVEIPKADGKMRLLGIPTVGDRIAQMVVKRVLEPLVEPRFHEDSYGYRPGKSALQAVGKARQRCWKENWVIDLDIRGFFDNLDHDLMMKAVKFHCKDKWVHLYIERWLKAPMQIGDDLIGRQKGTPQGGVISPLLANLFMHYAFDEWLRKQAPEIKFERYADDIIIHCSYRKKAEQVLGLVRARLLECGLELHPEKTKIAFCNGSKNPSKYPQIAFDFLGYTFRPRQAIDRQGIFFMGFLPAISNKAGKRLRDEIRSWRIGKYSDRSLKDIALKINAKVRGWRNYYGAYYPTALASVLAEIEKDLIQWAKRKFKSLRGRTKRAKKWLSDVAKREPNLFEHWK
jgi:RNA-directed DNA polymerase